jgi:hypothetical protein
MRRSGFLQFQRLALNCCKNGSPSGDLFPASFIRLAPSGRLNLPLIKIEAHRNQRLNMDAARFREQAALCRRLAKQATTADTAERLRSLAAGYDEMVECVERKARARLAREPALEAPSR